MIIRIITLITLVCISAVNAGDLGKEEVGRMRVKVYYATNSDPSVAGKGLAEIHGDELKKLKRLRNQQYAHYRLLGMDRQPIFRSYENWLTPLKPSEEILISFEPRGDAQSGQMMLDLELWQSRKKIMKAGPTLKKGQPLFIFGPKWRGGQLLLAIEILELIE